MSKTARATKKEILEMRLQQRRQTENQKSSEKNPAKLRVARSTIMATKGLRKSYYKKKLEIPVLRGVDLEIRENEFTAVVGKSGSGKSTLLHLLGTLDRPDQGEIWYQGNRIDNMRAGKCEHLRNAEFGMIFQFYHLLPELTTLENVLVPRMIGDGVLRYWKNKKKYRDRANELLELVGLSHRITHKPNQLSGGEMQRAAIARALITEPKLLLADEPTGNLDAENGSEVLETLLKLNCEKNLTIVMVTHDDNIAKQAEHLVQLVDGKVA
jgi:lipoprotein-releasing system ATP-binding protein